MYTMDWPGPVICMYVCVGTVSHGFEPTDLLVVVLAFRLIPVKKKKFGLNFI